MLGTLRWRKHVQDAEQELRGSSAQSSAANGETSDGSPPPPIPAERDRV